MSTALDRKRLLEIGKLNRGFTRPEHPGQVGLSYRQAGLITELVLERWGMEMVARILALFAEGKTTEHVIPEATGLTLEEFNRDMYTYLEEVIRERWRAEPTMDPSQLDYYLRRIERTPDDADLHIRVARLYFVQDNMSKAREHAERSLEIGGELVEAEEILARIAQKENQPSDAAEHAQRALELGGERFYPHMVLGLLHEASGETEEAIAEFEKARDIRPRYVWADNPYEKLAKLYEKLGQKERSLAVKRELLAFHDTDAGGRMELARAYLADSTRSVAIELMEETLHITLFDAAVHGTLGKAYLDERMPNEAVRALSRAVELEPRDALYRLDLASAYQQIGKTEMALEQAREALDLDPDLTEAEKLIEELGG
jgi:tetratricopeptide (TPR) repeat protein